MKKMQKFSSFNSVKIRKMDWETIYLPFIVSFDDARFTAISQVVDQVDTAANDKEACHPEDARVAAEDNLLIRCGTNVNILCGWNNDALAHVMIPVVTFDDWTSMRWFSIRDFSSIRAGSRSIISRVINLQIWIMDRIIVSRTSTVGPLFIGGLILCIR